jgi:23S rRNA (uridine2552-2'-O)-methyltransferase
MKRSKTSRQWMMEHVNDVFVKRARSEGYRSRAAYKLLEIAKRDKLLRPGMMVVDLGAAPGGWSQVARAQVGARGQVFALDVLEMAALPGVIFLQGDFREAGVEAQLREALGGRQVDLVLSDMSPNISGIALSDQARVMHLAELALEFAVNHLKPGGSLLVKVFQGTGFQEFFQEMRPRFKKIATRKPEASRGRSNELYLVGIDLQASAPAADAGALTEVKKRV